MIQPHETPVRAWAICTVARSGSTWLCDLAKSTGRLGAPAEYFTNRDRWYRQFGLSQGTSVEDYLSFLMQCTSTPNGIFGIKGGCHQLRPFFDCFGDVPCVWLRRINRLEQAISWYRADQCGLWHAMSKEVPSRESAYNPEQILEYVDLIEHRDQVWIDWFSEQRILPLEVRYEDVCRNPLSTIRAIADHVGVPSAQIQNVYSSHQIVRDATTQLWVDRLTEIVGPRMLGSD